MKTIFITGLMTLYLCISGCGLERRQAADSQHFLLHVERDPSAPPIAEQACLQVRPVRMAASFSGRSLVYRTGEVSYEQDYYNRFLTTPDKQITGILQSWFEQAGMSECISGNADLQARIRTFCADFTDTGNPAAVVVMHVTVTAADPRDGARRPALTKTYTARTPLPQTPSAAGVVQGLSTSLTDILQRLESDLVTAE